MTYALSLLNISEQYNYLAFAVAPQDLGEAVRALRLLNCQGANVTIPHKRAVIEHCTMVDDDVRRIGAANVLVANSSGFSAHNTDAPAAARALSDHRVTIEGRHAVIVGSGGSARAVAVGLAREGLRSLTVLARNEAQSIEVLKATDGLGLSFTDIAPWSARSAEKALSAADIIVQCTPLGMQSARSSPTLVEADPDYQTLIRWLDFAKSTAAAMDLVYAPVRTPWLRQAQSLGLLPVDGLFMLAHQGALALTRWCGNSPSVAILRQFLDGSETAR